jgi:succinate dehydrogenase/fumarate reductase iron-sulfur protein
MTKLANDSENGNNRVLKVYVKRFNPSIDHEPYWQTFEVPREHVARLLDVVEYIQQRIDPTLAIRPHYCRDLVCNACYIQYNGKPRMSCMTPLTDKIKEITLEPMEGYVLIRDLVVDFMQKTE